MDNEHPIVNPLPNEQLFQARLKANDYVANYLKQLIGLSTGTLVLTVTFLKNVLGAHASSAILTGLVPIAWVLLAISIFFCVWGLARITANLDTPDMETGKSGFPKAFLAGSKVMVPSAFGSLSTFAAAMILLAIFAAVNFSIFFQDVKSTQAEKTAIRAEQAANQVDSAALLIFHEAKRIAELLKAIRVKEITTYGFEQQNQIEKKSTQSVQSDINSHRIYGSESTLISSKIPAKTTP